MPPHCEICGRASDDPRSPVCKACFERVELVGSDYCRRCGAVQGSFVGIISTCMSCDSELTGFGTSQIVAVGSHEGLLREAILALKFGGRRSLAKVLAAWMAQTISDRGINVDLVVPVPLSFNREWKRGFNQSTEIAKNLAATLGCQLETRAVRRIRHTRPQAQLNESARRTNLSRAFAKGKRSTAVAGKRVLVVDDVMTTGATMRAVAGVLRRSGAADVFGVVAARTGK